jgi:hypothetical protein
MRRRLAFCAGLSLLFFPAMASADTYDSISEQYQKAMQEWYTSAGDSGPDMSNHPVKDYIPKFKKLADTDEDSEGAIRSLVWLMQNSNYLKYSGDSAGAQELSKWATDQLKQRLPKSKHAGKVLPELTWAVMSMDLNEAVALYEDMLAQKLDDETRAQAMFNLGFALCSDFVQRPADRSREDDAKRAEKLFRTIVKDFKDTKAAEQAEPYIFELEHLQVGMTAPDIVGKDIDGKEIKLSSFRGQVVIVDFWGFW